MNTRISSSETLTNPKQPSLTPVCQNLLSPPVRSANNPVRLRYVLKICRTSGCRQSQFDRLLLPSQRLREVGGPLPHVADCAALPISVRKERYWRHGSQDVRQSGQPGHTVCVEVGRGGDNLRSRTGWAARSWHRKGTNPCVAVPLAAGCGLLPTHPHPQAQSTPKPPIVDTVDLRLSIISMNRTRTLL